MSTHLTHSTTDITLVLGATGKTGSRVAQRLQDLGRPIRLGSRGADPGFDWDERSTWEPAVAGASAAYVSYFPDLAVPGAAETVGDFARVAVAGGVRRIVLLSGRGEPEARRAERLVAEAGAEWTVLRCSWFNQNFSEGYLLDPILAGEVVLPVDGVPEPFVDVDDIADVAVAALTQDGHGGEVYELTGPRALRFDEAIGEIARAAGREVRFEAVPVEPFAAAMREQHVPEDVVGLFVYLFGEVLDGRNVEVCDGVRRALGREPRDFAEYARRAAATGVWSVAR